jgi:hypothetical protein
MHMLKNLILPLQLCMVQSKPSSAILVQWHQQYLSGLNDSTRPQIFFLAHRHGFSPIIWKAICFVRLIIIFRNFLAICWSCRSTIPIPQFNRPGSGWDANLPPQRAQEARQWGKPRNIFGLGIGLGLGRR